MSASIDDLLRRALSSVATTFDTEAEVDRAMVAQYGDLVERRVGGWDIRIKFADDGSVVSSSILSPELIYTLIGVDDREISGDQLPAATQVVPPPLFVDVLDDGEVEVDEWPADLDDDDPGEGALVASVPTPAVTEPVIAEPAAPARRRWSAVSWLDEDAPGWKPWMS